MHLYDALMAKDIHDIILNELLLANIRGMTYKDLLGPTGKGHGSVSGALSLLHGEGKVFYTTYKRSNCQVYVHNKYKSSFKNEERVDAPVKNKAEQYLEALEDVIAAYMSKKGLHEAVIRASQVIRED